MNEGERLKEYFLERVAFIKERVEIIKKHKEQVVGIYKEKLLKRLDSIRGEVTFKEEDILKEIFFLQIKVIFQKKYQDLIVI